MWPAPTARARPAPTCAPSPRPAAEGARLHLAASGPLQRAHPHRRRLIEDGALAALLDEVRAPTPASRSPSSRSPPPPPFWPSPAQRRRPAARDRARRPSSMPPTDRAARLAAITPISLDHQPFLGDTVAEIAGEKAGIIKHGRPAVLAPQPTRRRCSRRAPRRWARRFVAGRDWPTPTATGPRYGAALGEPRPAAAQPSRRPQFANAGTALAASTSSEAARSTTRLSRGAAGRGLAGAAAGPDRGRLAALRRRAGTVARRRA